MDTTLSKADVMFAALALVVLAWNMCT